MDVIDSDTPRNIDQNQQMKESVEDTDAFIYSDGKNEENVCVKLEEKTATQKEAIEIIKVELVAPWKSEIKSGNNVNSEDTLKEKEDASFLRLEEMLVEDEIENKKSDDSTLELNEIDRSNEENDHTNGRDEKSDSVNCHSVEHISDIPEEKKLETITCCNVEYVEDIPVMEIENSSKLPQVEQQESLNTNSNELVTSISDPLGTTTTNSLSLLSQYHSDDDTESVIEVPTSTQDYRNHVVEIDSGSESDDSSDTSGVEYLNELRKTIDKRMDEIEDDEDDNEDNTSTKRHRTKLRVKGEMLLEDLPPIQDLQITVPENECVEFGKIHSIVDQLLLVSALPNSILLNLETVIFLERGQKVLGEVFDVLGQVADPLYCVRFNSNKQIKEKHINIGDLVYVAPKTQYTQYVILSNVMNLKGSDASWENDIEPPPRFLDYSDDEQEQLAKRNSRNKDRPIDNEDPTKRPRTADDFTLNKSHNSNTPYKNRYTDQRYNRGAPGHSNENTGTRYDRHSQNQLSTPNQHRSSWHSNYYPQSLPSRPTGTYGMHSTQNQPHCSQAYPPHVPVYAMPPPMYNMSYPPPRPAQYGAPRPIFHQHRPQLLPNECSIRRPTIHRLPHAPHNQQYISAPPPPPPGSQ